MFSTVWGCSFGLASAVLVFNRTPALAVAAARRYCGSVVNHYFDDSQSFGLANHRCASQKAIRGVVDARQPSKPFPMAPRRVVLGVHARLAGVREDGYVSLAVLQSTRTKLCRELDMSRSRGEYSPALAATIHSCSVGLGSDASL